MNNHKMLPGNIFGLILKNKMAARDVYSTLNKDFCWPSRAKDIMDRDLKFAGYVPHSGGNGKPVTCFSFVSDKNNEIRKEYLGTGN